MKIFIKFGFNQVREVDTDDMPVLIKFDESEKETMMNALKLSNNKIILSPKSMTKEYVTDIFKNEI